jgi:hypothetical protein
MPGYDAARAEPGGNPWAGEVALVVDGRRRAMRLTLGALAELEAALEAGSLVDLVERFETGRFRARDVAALLLAGLRGGGWDGAARDLATAEIDGGMVEATRAAALLIGRAFALPSVAR